MPPGLLPDLQPVPEGGGSLGKRGGQSPSVSPPLCLVPDLCPGAPWTRVDPVFQESWIKAGTYFLFIRTSIYCTSENSGILCVNDRSAQSTFISDNVNYGKKWKGTEFIYKLLKVIHTKLMSYETRRVLNRLLMASYLGP